MTQKCVYVREEEKRGKLWEEKEKLKFARQQEKRVASISSFHQIERIRAYSAQQFAAELMRAVFKDMLL